jgi:hypothetical protein
MKNEIVLIHSSVDMQNLLQTKFTKMKKSIFVFILFSVTLIYNDPVIAQVKRTAPVSTGQQSSPRNYTSAGDIITVNDLTVPIQNLYTLDSARSLHMASFEIELNQSDDSKKMLTNLISAIQKNQSMEITFKRLDFQYQVMGEKVYRGAIVNEIVFSEFDGGSKDAWKIKVKVQAQNVSEKDGGNEKVSLMIGRNKAIVSDHFKFIVGTLPTEHVNRISSIKVTNSNGYTNFNIEVTWSDSKPWKDWYNTGAGGSQNATLSLMDATFSEFASFQISGVDIISVSESGSTPQDALLKTTVGLRARRIEYVK